MVCNALRRNDGNVSHSAKDLGISRATLHDLLKKYAINIDSYRNKGKTR